MKYFTDQNGPKEGPHENKFFEYFQIQKQMLQTVTAGKGDEEYGVTCVVSMFPKNLSLLQQFTCIRLKGLVTLFQKMVLFIMI